MMRWNPGVATTVQRPEKQSPESRAKSTLSRAGRYLVTLWSSIALTGALALAWGFSQPDHFAAITFAGDPDWILNYSQLYTREMDDRDWLFNGIGESVANLQRADIVILGHSVLEFGLDYDQMRKFSDQYGIRIFNMSLPGVASGSFAKSILEKWNVRPKLFMINFDDEPEDFFKSDLNDYFTSGRNSVVDIVRSNRIQGEFHAALRNVAVRVERIAFRFLPASTSNLFFPLYRPYPLATTAPTSYRSPQDGMFNLQEDWGFNSAGAHPIEVTREKGCTIDVGEVSAAEAYVKDLGAPTVLMLIPYDRWCPQRVMELADELGVERILPSDANFDVWDGRHMGRAGAKKYTAFLIDALKKTDAFQSLIGRTPRSVPITEPIAPIEWCYRNNSAQRTFVSARFHGQIDDFAAQPQQVLKESGHYGGRVCRSDQPFGHAVCPNSTPQRAMPCPP